MESATFKPGQSLPLFLIGTIECSKISVIKRTAGNLMTFQAPISVSMLITKSNSMNDKDNLSMLIFKYFDCFE